MREIKILKSRVHVINVDYLHDHIKDSISENNKKIVGNLNIHAANIAFKSDSYRKFLDECSIVFCDGKGIQLGAWLLGEVVPSQITYHTWTWQLLQFCEDNKFSLFFLGSKDGVGQEAIIRMKKIHPNLKLGCHHGYFNKIGKENDKVIEKINKFNPHIIIVGFGMPLQENWILENHTKIRANIFLNGGAFLEWMSGNQKQSPAILTRLGLEWLYRLIKEPRRLFNRYVIGNPLFIYRIFKQRFFNIV